MEGCDQYHESKNIQTLCLVFIKKTAVSWWISQVFSIFHSEIRGCVANFTDFFRYESAQKFVQTAIAILIKLINFQMINKLSRNEWNEMKTFCLTIGQVSRIRTNSVRLGKVSSSWKYYLLTFLKSNLELVLILLISILIFMRVF